MKRIAVLLLVALSILSGCGKTNDLTQTNIQVPPNTVEKTDKHSEEKAITPNFTKENYPRIDGSTATIPLSEGVAAKLLAMSPDEAGKFVNHTKTHNAYVNLLNGKADIIFVTEPSEDELNLAKEKNIELEIVPIVKDAFVFLVNTDNPIKSLTKKQIQDIYQGKIKNWKEVGGKDAEIIAYQRPKNSGSQTIMENMVMKGLKLVDAPKEYTPSEMGELIEKVAGFDNSNKAIGYSVYYYAKTMYTKDTIKLIGIDGVSPDKETIISGKYPYSSAYYAVIKKSEKEDSGARKLLSWILSDEGQKICEGAGYVPLR